MDHSKSSTANVPLEALLRNGKDVRQSYALLAFGIVIALVLPFLLRPHAAPVPPATAAAMSSPSPPTSRR